MMTTREKQKKRREDIFSSIKKGGTLIDIGKKFGVTRQRVMQIERVFGLNRQSDAREHAKQLYDKLVIDLNNNLSINEITDKYKMPFSEISYIYNKFSSETLRNIYKNKRNNKIINDYVNGAKAIDIVNNKDKVLGDPTKLTVVNSIYTILRKTGNKRYPQIGNRAAGGSSEKKKILRFIVTKHDRKTNPLTFQQIADELNMLGYRTITGKTFSMANTTVKYHAYIKELNK